MKKLNVKAIDQTAYRLGLISSTETISQQLEMDLQLKIRDGFTNAVTDYEAQAYINLAKAKGYDELSLDMEVHLVFLLKEVKEELIHES